MYERLIKIGAWRLWIIEIERENIKVEQSSGNEKADNAAIDAVKKSTLPKPVYIAGAKQDPVDFLMTFEYNVGKDKKKSK